MVVSRRPWLIFYTVEMLCVIVYAIREIYIYIWIDR